MSRTARLAASLATIAASLLNIAFVIVVYGVLIPWRNYGALAPALARLGPPQFAIVGATVVTCAVFTFHAWKTSAFLRGWHLVLFFCTPLGMWAYPAFVTARRGRES